MSGVYGFHMNEMQIAAQVIQADWLETVATRRTFSPYPWTISEVEDVLDSETTNLIHDYWGQSYTGYWL